MTEYLKIIRSDSVQSVAEQAFPDSPFLILETTELEDTRSVMGVPAYVIVDRLTPAIDPDRYPSGRIFDDSGELRWREAEGCRQIVYIGSGLQKEDERIESSEPLENFEAKDVQMILLGEKVANAKLIDEMNFTAAEAEEIFIEPRIPQYLQYPIESAERGRVQVQVREFYNQLGELEYYRFVALENVT